MVRATAGARDWCQAGLGEHHPDVRVVAAVFSELCEQRARGDQADSWEAAEDVCVGMLGQCQLEGVVVVVELAVEQAEQFGEDQSRV